MDNECLDFKHIYILLVIILREDSTMDVTTNKKNKPTRASRNSRNETNITIADTVEPIADVSNRQVEDNDNTRERESRRGRYDYVLFLDTNSVS